MLPIVIGSVPCVLFWFIFFVRVLLLLEGARVRACGDAAARAPPRRTAGEATQRGGAFTLTRPLLQTHTHYLSAVHSSRMPWKSSAWRKFSSSKTSATPA